MKKEYEDAKVMTAVSKASKGMVRANRGTYHMTLIDGTEIDIPVHVCSHAVAMQAQKGEKFVDTDEDTIDPERNLRIWLKKVNAGLDDGWTIINDLNEPQEFDGKNIPLSQITTEEYLVLEAALFPGSELNRKSMRERVSEVFSKK